LRTNIIDNDEMEATESSPSPRSRKSKHHAVKKENKDKSPDRLKGSVLESSNSPIPDESVQSPETIRSRKSVDKIHRKEKDKEREKEKEKDKDSRRKSKSKKDRDEPSFLESTEFKLTM
jgi:hypothetical protein